MAKLTLITDKPGSPPRPLRRHGQALWNRITSDYDVTDAAGIELLTLACESLDRAGQLSDLITYAGAGSVSETGIVRSNPMVKDELACRAFVSKCLERLGLNSEAPKANGRPAGSFRAWDDEKAKAATSQSTGRR